MTSVSVHQQKVLDAFHALDTDIDIVVLYTRVYGDPGQLSVREMQQRLAPTFRLINTRLPNCRIELGDVKRTYRRTTKKKV